MLYSSLLETVLLPLGDVLIGSQVMRQLRAWRRIQELPESKILEMQREKLAVMLKHAVTTIPYYSKIPVQSGDPEEWLRSFPILRKGDIKGRWEQFINPNAKGLIAYESSGSSGIQGKVYLDKTAQSVIRAIMMLWWEWAGYKLGNSVLQTGMTPNRGLLKGIKDRLLRTEYMVAFNLSDDTMLRHLAKAESKGYDHLAGYASSLYLLGETAKKQDMRIHFDSVISWGDKMFAHYRRSIERTFQTRVYDTYACNEGLMIAAQKDHDFYYQMAPHTYLELLDAEGHPVPDGELGHVVVTNLDNFAMPLIRYYVGDLAVRLPRQRYPEKRELGFPLLERIIGRDTDIVRTPSGKFLIVHFFTGIFEFYPEIRQFRVVQTSLDYFTIEYIRENTFTEAILDEIRVRIYEHLGENVHINFVEVDHIPSTPSGKPQIISSEIRQ